MVTKVREAVREAGASLLGALAVSTILTVSIAFPLAVRAVDASDGPDGIDDAIALDDARFPAPVHLGTEQAEILARDDDTDDLDAEVAGATVTAPSPPPTSTEEPAEETELAIVIPTPTPEPGNAPPAPTPAPPPPTATPVPTEQPTTEDAAPEPDPTPTEQPTSEAAPPTPETEPEPDADARDGLADEPEELLDGPATDVYAYISGEPLRENEVSSLEVKTVNSGTEMTTGLSVAVTASGGSILSMAPGRPDWTCSGTDAAWRCTGPTLEAESFSRSLMTVLPEDEELSLSVSVTHELADAEPDNNTFSAELPVEPDPVEPVDPPVEPIEPPLEPVEPPVDPAPPTDPTDPVDPADPGGGGTGGPTDPADPADPVDPPPDPVDPIDPPPDPGDPVDPGSGTGGVGQPGEGADEPATAVEEQVAETPAITETAPD